MKLTDIKTAHFVGVGGIGMSALARLCMHEGISVSGSDRTVTPLVQTLQSEGMRLCATQTRENITSNIDCVIYTEAMSPDHEELVRARELGIPTKNYFDALGMVANDYYLIAVAGSHGKTTTTAMLIDILEDAGFDPTAIVGSLRAKTQGNYRAGKSKYCIVEACEYRRDFLSLTPDVLIMTNLEHEHVDYYTTLADVQAAFREFALQVREGGVVIADTHHDALVPVLEGLSVQIVDYTKYLNPRQILTVPGLHNHMNAAAARAAAAYLGIPDTTITTALTHFSGTWRRFEYKGEYNGACIYDDYGHHPTEIKATIQGARERHPDKRLTLVFQPHTYSRTHELFDDFVNALATADRVVLLPIYAAREEHVRGVTHTALGDALRTKQTNVYVCDTFDDAVQEIKKDLGDTDVVLVMGAGDVTQVSDVLVRGAYTHI